MSDLRGSISWSYPEEARAQGISLGCLRGMVRKHGIEVLRAGSRMLFDDVSSAQLSRALRPKSDKLLSAESILAAAKPPPTDLTGIYFLINGGAIVYIGQAVNVIARVANHMRLKAFDAWHWVPCSVSDLDALERAYILAFLPSLNCDSRTVRARRLAPK